jgi:TfoX/Sxy family transcriptional regulator of competence genes
LAYDEKAADRVRRALAGRRNLVEKKMMGAICFMVSGNMCCGVTGSALLVRVGRDAYARMLARPHVRPMEFAGRRPTGFVLVDPAGYRSDAALATWIKRGLDFVATLPAKKATAKKSGAKKRR